METIEKTSTTESGLTIKVIINHGCADKEINADGDIIKLGSEYVEFTSIYLIKDGKTVAHTGDLNFFYTLESRTINGRNSWANEIEKGAYARFGDKVVSKATYEAIVDLLSLAKTDQEPKSIMTEEKKEEEIVINPAYAHLSMQQIKEAEKNWDNVQNEGTTEGFNPYRDNLFIPLDQGV